jgi:ferric-dicitrate binding protein FerR (iron transport regulator)
METNARIKTLIDKVFTASATPAEFDELIAALKGTGYESVLQEMEAHVGDQGSDITDVSPDKWNRLVDNILQTDSGIAGRDSASPRPRRVRRRPLIRYAAAACMMAALILTALVVRKRSGNGSPAVAGKEKEKVLPVGEIHPGTNRAVLQLADGTMISLDSTRTGAIARQGSANILKRADGGIVYRPSSGTNSSEPLLNMLSTPRGGQFQLVLPDGTKVWLNAASYIRYPVSFDKKIRKVEVQGEVYLEVAKNADKPFIVDVGDGMEIKVLGTRFNVNTYKEERYRRMTLLEGAIGIVSSKGSKLLKPGEQALAGKDGGIRVEEVNTAAVVAWKNGLFDFSKSEIPSVMNQLARWYDIEVQYEGPLPEALYSGEMERDLNLSQVVKLLETAGIHIKIKNKTLVVMPK